MRRTAANAIDRHIAHAEPSQEGEHDHPNKAVQSPAEAPFEPYRGKIRKRGTGCVTRINDNLWEGRYTPTICGKRVARNVYAHSEDECESKLAELIRGMNAEREPAS
jgi:hypothetical protein